MTARGVRGFSLAVVLVVLALVMIGLIAGMALTRLGRANDDAANTRTRLQRAADALEQFAAGAHRLPCPANPAVDTGDEVPTVVGGTDCTYGEGTIPWRTIGLRHDDAYDAWGFKISYRVYTGSGSLVQPEGVSMVECDTVESTPAGTTASGLCKTNPDPMLRATTDTEFLAGKGLSLDDNGTAHPDTAYVILSHGATAMGAYTVAGTRMDLPNGDEKKNTNDTGPFTIKPFSPGDVAATNANHFDDLLVYRTLPDLVRRIGLSARNWPDPSASFSPSAITAATGIAVSPTGTTNLGTSSFTTGGVTVTGYTGSFVATNLTYDSTGGGGLGAAGGNGLLGALDGEWIRVQLPGAWRQLGLTLGDMGYFPQGGDTYVEVVGVRFWRSGALVDLQFIAGCKPDHDLLSFQLTSAADFDTVDVVPVQSFGVTFGGNADTQVLLYEAVGCPASATSCKTSLYSPARAC